MGRGMASADPARDRATGIVVRERKLAATGPAVDREDPVGRMDSGACRR
jgi:hypothetical protein